MDIIIVGCGKVGSRFASILSEEGHNVVIIDADKSNFQQLNDNFQGVLVSGNPIDEEVLKEAGIESTDALMAMTPDDNINIMACQIAKEKYNVQKVISRIFDPYKEKAFKGFGLETICPTDITIEVMKTKLLGEMGSSKHTIYNNILEFIYEKATKNILGKTLSEIKEINERFLFGILRDKELNLAKPSLVLIKGDILIWTEKLI